MSISDKIIFTSSKDTAYSEKAAFIAVFTLGKAAHKKKAFQITADTHIEVLSHSISDVKSEVLWRFY